MEEKNFIISGTVLTLLLECAAKAHNGVTLDLINSYVKGNVKEHIEAQPEQTEKPKKLKKVDGDE